MDYGKLKTMLREDDASKDADGDADEPWTSEDETRFCDEMFNVQLAKVSSFQSETFHSLKERIEAAFSQLRDMAPVAEEAAASSPGAVVAAERPYISDIALGRLRELEAELDAITNEVRELKKYSNLNYTAFLKIAKKHDRRRGESYRILPLTRNTLSKDQFNSERAFAPLLQKLGLMYFVIRHHLEGKDGAIEPSRTLPDLDSLSETHNGERYTAQKCKFSTYKATSMLYRARQRSRAAHLKN